jgi:hypothetical protein
MLANLDSWLGAAVAYAEHKKFAPDVLASARLAPDMYPLTRQVQSACDAAKFAAAYLAGAEAPAHPDTETTIAELRARIATCRNYLETITPESWVGGEARKVAPKWLHGGWMTGSEYLFELALPNFYFHVTTAYDILRHNGVELGKGKFIGSMPVKPATAG